ncbi:hypothetical protein COU62_01980 [Candidatus Pacearchaeota archaeon CG10_big_fil_rev_8_21_14_0_10_35_219]|nr:Hsp20/alpha crystallin family protein [Candidatus Pacearchaeota archaeon]OIO42526.1 MAG: hypothetical protein AUJ63_02480 [Candidatus Pacearchaeota archaeon CG1_02_35_32]PIO07961.1 MAG: hypothetical protein COU62_01980 [Candidatus Pacearchaeota archaeon CG10_big_fil_rev_8_21_14_0_10_35_219]PIY81416.1 MAG: hypothetical protein COY79_02790 [Candidatus Pacearchaeota archaeon CG_4_10_14_0_8_um_filter_35_169]PIZ80620.1 MAG: hypothetical protein COY00_00655 [Candidatus Pacearchaeota archaeon CG_4_
MSFFDDDPFESIFEEFFSPGRRVNRKGQFIRSEEDERVSDFIESGNEIYLVFELPGYNEEDIMIMANKGELEIKVQKKSEEVQSYLSQKLKQGLVMKRTLPKFVDTKKFSHTMKNGILEIKFKKK